MGGGGRVHTVLDEMEVLMAEYEAPRLEVVGSLVELTLADGSLIG